MDSNQAIIFILSLLVIVLLISSDVSARVLTENFSNTKRGDVEKINEVNKASFVNGGYRGYPYNGGGYIGSYYPGIGGGYNGNGGYGGGIIPGNIGGFGGGIPGNIGGLNGGIIPGNIGGFGGGITPGNVGGFSGGFAPGNIGGIMGDFLDKIGSYIGGYISGRLSNDDRGGLQTEDNTRKTRN